MRFFLFLAYCVLALAGCGDSGTQPAHSSGRGADDDAPARDAGASSAGDAGRKRDGGVRAPDGGSADEVPEPVEPGKPFHEDRTASAGLDPAVLDDLREGGPSCGARILHPYADTVFPAGLVGPTVMWEGASDASYLKLAFRGSQLVSYELAGGATKKGELKIPDADWDQIVRRAPPGAPLEVTLSTQRAGMLSTCRSQWRIAPGVMRGSLFFNTYNHPAKAGMGAVMRLTLGQAQSEVYLSYRGIAALAGPCISCHSVAANGGVLAASTHNYNPFTQIFFGNSYDVRAEPEPKPTAKLSESTFGALTPDGTRMLRMGNPDCTAGSNAFPRAPNNFMLLVGPTRAELVDTRTGKALPAKGLRPDWYMWMPQFSPRGDKVVFNHARPGPGGTIRRDLAVMDFDQATHTFSNLRVIVSNQGVAPSKPYAPLPVAGATVSPLATGAEGCTAKTSSPVGAIPGGSCTGPCYPAWPFFTPDGEGVVYALISEPDFAVAIPGRERPSKSELWYVDVTSGEPPVRLDRANAGLRPADAQANYYPTVLPVQVGGYYWLFWTSTRPWGNRDFSGNLTAIAQTVFSGPASLEAVKKRIWVSALRPRASQEGVLEPLTDFSAPPFYLEGQSDTGNIRAFAALNPCKQTGSTCTSGLDCCTGFCQLDASTGEGSCTDEKACSELNERCTRDEDCCPGPASEPERVCLGNFCGFRAPPI